MTIRVFEYETLTVGTAPFEQGHFDYLAQFAPIKYFQIGHRSIRFQNYVGAIQVGDLTIEILPKIDKKSEEKELWRNVLIEMLRYCRLLPIESLGNAQLALQSNSILDLYYELFLLEVEKVLHQGIYSSYQSVKSNQKSLKGSLQFETHLRLNWLHKERFFTRHDRYNSDNLHNQILAAALQLLQKIALSTRLKLKLQSLQVQFAQYEIKTIQLTDFESIRYTRQNQHYRTAIKIAQLLLLQNRPSLRTGQQQLIALLFDMNALFEEYIFRQLCRVRNPNLQVSRQERKAFWNKQHIRPDILVQYKNIHYVIDTKWKLLKKPKPSMSDLQQAFVYGQYFDAKSSILLYPHTGTAEHLRPQAFELTEEYSCGLFFAEVLKDGKLNLNLGAEILAYLE